jgi:phosphatidylglycerol:prolipoprotein diacylglycerol transferase
MHPTLFSIGKLNIPTYTVLLDLGLILGLVLTYFEGKRALQRGEIALDLGLWAVIGGILGGRIGYVLAHWSAFSEDWTGALRIWEGGLSFHGAFLGGLAVMAIFALLQRKAEQPVSFWQLGDVVTPGLALGITFGWAACLMGGCSYGIVGEGLGYAILPDLYGVEASRFATQAVGLGFSLVLFLGFWLLRRRWPFAGASFLMYLLLYFAGQFLLEFTRGDEAIYLGPWRLAQWLDLVLALAAAAGLLVLWWQDRNRVEGQEEILEIEESEEPGEAEAQETEVGEAEGPEGDELEVDAEAGSAETPEEVEEEEPTAEE